MIKLIKLVTGEEIIAKIDESDTTVDIENPVKLTLSSKGVAMMPLSPFMKSEKIIINKTNIVFTADVEDEVANAYNEQFGGIIVPPTSLTLGF